MCKSCHGGQAVSEYTSPEPVACGFLPSGLWQDCAADILGPLSSGESLMIVVDYFSGYSELVILTSSVFMQTDCALSKSDVRTDQIMFLVHFGISSAHSSL